MQNAPRACNPALEQHLIEVLEVNFREFDFVFDSTHAGGLKGGPPFHNDQMVRDFLIVCNETAMLYGQISFGPTTGIAREFLGLIVDTGCSKSSTGWASKVSCLLCINRFNCGHSPNSTSPMQLWHWLGGIIGYCTPRLAIRQRLDEHRHPRRRGHVTAYATADLLQSSVNGPPKIPIR